jgi:hypothetical protein
VRCGCIHSLLARVSVSEKRKMSIGRNVHQSFLCNIPMVGLDWETLGVIALGKDKYVAE